MGQNPGYFVSHKSMIRSFAANTQRPKIKPYWVTEKKSQTEKSTTEQFVGLISSADILPGLSDLNYVDFNQ